jgi:hypothetical protein
LELRRSELIWVIATSTEEKNIQVEIEEKAATE